MPHTSGGPLTATRIGHTHRPHTVRSATAPRQRSDPSSAGRRQHEQPTIAAHDHDRRTRRSAPAHASPAAPRECWTNQPRLGPQGPARRADPVDGTARRSVQRRRLSGTAPSVRATVQQSGRCRQISCRGDQRCPRRTSMLIIPSVPAESHCVLPNHRSLFSTPPNTRDAAPGYSPGLQLRDAARISASGRASRAPGDNAACGGHWKTRETRRKIPERPQTAPSTITFRYALRGAGPQP